MPDPEPSPTSSQTGTGMTQDHQRDEFVRHVLLSAMKELKSLPNGSSTLKTIAEASKGIPIVGAPVRVLVNLYDCVKTKTKTANAQMAIENTLLENQTASEWPMHFSKAIILFALEIYFCFQNQFQAVKLNKGNEHGAKRILGDLFGKTLVQSMADTAKSVDSKDQRKIISKLSKILNFDNLLNRMSTKADQYMGKILDINCDGSTKNISAFQFFERPAPIFYFLQSKKYYTNEKATKMWKYRRCLIGEWESDGLKKFPFPPTPTPSTSRSVSRPCLEMIVESDYFTHQFPLEDGKKQVECLFETFQHDSEFEEIYEAWKTKILQEIDSKIDQVLRGIEELTIKDRRLLMGSSSCGESGSSELRIWFNIPVPIESFYGRENLLTQLHDNLKPRDDSIPEVTVLSQVKIVSGLGGVGKTETARKYIMKYRQCYNNCIWIDAESQNSMTNSFIKLAIKIQIPVKNAEEQEIEIEEILQEIYNKICEGGQSNLIVFDNAEDYESSHKFLPFELHPDLKKPVILATSRNQEWNSPTGKIQVVPLDVLPKSESLEFILKELDIPDAEIPGFRKESKEFIELIGGLPLALQQAVAYIRQQKELREFLGTPYKISDYVQEFKSCTKEFQTFSPFSASHSPTVFVTWNVTFAKIQSLENGTEAVKILEILSFLYADKIPSSFLRSLVPEIHDKEYMNALQLLKKYSMIKINSKDFFLSIHRQLQFVLLQSLSKRNQVSKVVASLVEKCSRVLNTSLSKRSDIFLNIHQIANNQFNLIPVTAEFIDFMHEFGSVLSKESRHSEALEVFIKVYKNWRELLGENHETTLAAKQQIGIQLIELGRYNNKLSLRRNVRKRKTDLGVDLKAIAKKYNIAAVLRPQENFGEFLEGFQQDLAQKVKILGGNDRETLSTQGHIALAYSKLGDFSTASDLFETVGKQQIEILGPHHKDVLTTKYNKAQVLFEMGSFGEALKILNEVNDKRQEHHLGDHHVEKITLSRIADTLTEGGLFTEALEIFNKVYGMRVTNLGVDHPSTITTKAQMAEVLLQQKKYPESLELFQQVLSQQKKIHGKNHLPTHIIQRKMAVLFLELGEFSMAMELFEKAEKERIEILVSDDSALFHTDKFEEASRIFNEFYEKRKEILGETHLDTFDSLEWVADSLEQQRKFTQALEIHKKVYEIRKEHLGEHHPDTLNSRLVNKMLFIVLKYLQ